MQLSKLPADIGNAPARSNLVCFIVQSARGKVREVEPPQRCQGAVVTVGKVCNIQHVIGKIGCIACLVGIALHVVPFKLDDPVLAEVALFFRPLEGTAVKPQTSQAGKRCE